MATKKHSTKKHSTKKHMTKKHSSTSKSQKNGEMMAWCVKCSKMVKMVEHKEVAMKGRGGVSRKRLAGKDVHGHNVSRIL
jgi:hypothetical protein